MAQQEIVYGVVSDTHGVIRPAVTEALTGVDGIIHAGDIGSPEVLQVLAAVAPVFAVRGNTDRAPLSTQVPWTQVVQAGEVMLYVLHDLFQLDLDPRAAGFAAVISGHTHRGAVARKDGVLYLNPGSAGHGRGDHAVTIATLRICKARLEAEIIALSD